MRARLSPPVLALLALALLGTAGVASAQLTPTLNPGDTLRFVGADFDASTTGDCESAVAECFAAPGDLGVENARAYVSTSLVVGAGFTQVSATARLIGSFKISGDNGNRIGAKLDGRVRWRGWLMADFGAWDNFSSVEIAVAIYDVTTATQPADLYRHLVARQTLYTNSVAGRVSAIPTFERGIGSGSFNLAVDLFRGHEYFAVVEATSVSSSGLLGISTTASFSEEVFALSPLNDGFVERNRMILRTELDWLELIEDLRDDFQGHRHEYLTGRGEGHNNTEAETSAPLDSAGATAGGLHRPGDALLGPAIEVRTAAPDHVRLAVRLPEGAEPGALLERSGDGLAWTALGLAAGGSEWVDRDVAPGVRYAYRAHATVGGVAHAGEAAWIRTPDAFGFDLAGAHPNPALDGLVVRFSIPDAASASLELFDVAGRRVLAREVGTMGPGQHTLRLAERGALPAGVYLLRLTRGGQALSSRLSVMR